MSESLERSRREMFLAAQPRWELHLKHLQTERDRLIAELEEANKAIADHIFHRNQWLDYFGTSLAVWVSKMEAHP